MRKAAGEILAEIKPAVEDLTSNLADLIEYQNSELKKKIDAYSENVRKQELQNLLSRVSKQYRYTPTLNPGQSRFKELDRFVTSKSNSLPSNRFEIYEKNRKAFQKKSLSLRDLRRIEADLKPYAAYLKELENFMGNREFTFAQTDFSTDNVLTKNLAQYRHMVRILELRIRLKLAKNEPQQALQDANFAYRVSRALETSRFLRADAIRQNSTLKTLHVSPLGL